MISPKKRDRYLTLSKDAVREEFKEFCYSGKWEEIHFFTKREELLAGLTEKELTYNLSIALESAVAGRHLDVVKYLLTSPKLSYHADIDYNRSECLIKAARLNHLEMIKYFLASSELDKHANPHAQLDALFLIALKHKDKEIVEYLIFDYKIEKTERIEQHLENTMIYNQNKEDILKMFEQRDLQNRLEKELPLNNNLKKNKL